MADNMFPSALDYWQKISESQYALSQAVVNNWQHLLVCQHNRLMQQARNYHQSSSQQGFACPMHWVEQSAQYWNNSMQDALNASLAQFFDVNRWSGQVTCASAKASGMSTDPD